MSEGPPPAFPGPSMQILLDLAELSMWPPSLSTLKETTRRAGAGWCLTDVVQEVVTVTGSSEV